ncbi:MAG: mechanosensitive ion channel protein MscS, partial [Alphaproteobacteria bacterium]
ALTAGPLAELWTPVAAIELVGIALLLVLAYFLGRWFSGVIAEIGRDYPAVARIERPSRPFLPPIVALLLLAGARVGAAAAGLVDLPFEIALNLLAAWLVIRLAVTLIRSRGLRRLVASLAWSAAALNILGLWQPLMRLLDSLSVEFGEFRLSLLSLLQGVVAFALLVWLAQMLAGAAERRLARLDRIDPSLRALGTKVIRILLYSTAVLFGLSAMGIDLTALAVFSGALGVGIGFGLQKVVANFISGLILLMDRSIKPGDVIETQGTYGWINHLGARYTSIITRDGTEYLIPNEDLITQPVINWSFSDRRVRRRLKVAVSYDSDIEEAMRLMVEAAREQPRVLALPEPVTQLNSFGDNGVELELRFWIEDPQNGIGNVSSDVLLAIWHRFHAAGISFPYPQRVIHFAHGQGQAESGHKDDAD